MAGLAVCLQSVTQPAFAMQGDKGWSDAALISGAQHIGLSPAAIGLLPRGPAELVEARCCTANLGFGFCIRQKEKGCMTLQRYLVCSKIFVVAVL